MEYLIFRVTLLQRQCVKIARWYDVDVRLEGDFSDIEIMGEIGRNLNLSDVLGGMEDKNIHFTLKKPGSIRSQIIKISLEVPRN